MNPEEPVRRDEMTDDEMADVQARTTPGTDPRVEELRREQEMRDRGEPRTATGDPAEDDRAAAPAYGGVNQDTDYENGPGERGTVMDRGNLVDRGEYGASSGAGAGLEEYRARFTDAQTRFIDDPKGAVEEARSVLEEAVDRLMGSPADDSATTDETERMRMTMQRYRSLFDRLVETGR